MTESRIGLVVAALPTISPEESFGQPAENYGPNQYSCPDEVPAM